MKIKDAAKLAVETLVKCGPAGCVGLMRSYVNLVSEPDVMSTGPLMIQVEPTLHCNLECAMCVNPLTSRIKRHMPFRDFQKIIDDIPSLKKISLVGAGEPLLNPDIFKMTAYAKSRGILTGFATNAMLLDDEMCAKIINSGLDWINISVDSADKKKYEKIRKGAGFDALLENSERLVSVIGRRPAPELSIWFVIMKDNLDDLPGVIALAGSLGIARVSAQLEHSWSDERLRSNMIKRDGMEFRENIRRIMETARQTAQRANVSISFVNVPDETSGRACKWPWKSSYITAEGFVTPCCLQGSDPTKVNFGNILKQDFEVIWNGAAYQDFRAALKSGTPPDICRGCTSYFKSIRI